jgi:hypothetical protein
MLLHCLHQNLPDTAGHDNQNSNSEYFHIEAYLIKSLGKMSICLHSPFLASPESFSRCFVLCPEYPSLKPPTGSDGAPFLLGMSWKAATH